MANEVLVEVMVGGEKVFGHYGENVLVFGDPDALIAASKRLDEAAQYLREYSQGLPATGQEVSSRCIPSRESC